MKSQGKLPFAILWVLLLMAQQFAWGQTPAEQQWPDMSYLHAERPKGTRASDKPVITADGYFDNLEAAKASPAQVVRLNLQNHNLKAIPADLCLFPNLKELDLSHNQLTSLDVSFQCPSQLKKLYINNNQIQEIPARIAQVPQLEVLVAYNNPITRIDAAIGKLQNLHELWLSGNDNMASFQPAIWNLHQLKTLRLWNFGFQDIPDAIAGFQQLETFCVAHNQIQSLNPKVCSLPRLEYLNLGDNQLQSLPAEIKNCTLVGYLGIYDNPIATLPVEFSLLSKNLEQFSAWNTGLSAASRDQLSRSFTKTTLTFEAEGLH
jgi:Leucine-rich repeat (LRR) protein